MTRSASLSAYLQLIRAPNVITSVSNILAAYLIMAPEPVRLAELGWLMLASALLYSGGIILNDCFDYETDCRERPERPLPAAAIPLTRAWWLGGFCLATGVLLAAFAGSSSLIIAVILALLIIAYDGWIDKASFTSACFMGGCRYGNWLLGLSLFPLTAFSFLLALPILFYVTGLTLLSKVEVHAENRQPLQAAMLFIISSAAVLALLVLSGQLPQPWSLAALAAGLILIMIRFYRCYRDFSASQVQGTVKLMVLGIIPLDALLVWAAGSWQEALLVLALLIPARWLAGRLYVT